VKPGRAAAKPYARALHDLAKERRQTDAIARELEAVAALVAGEPPLRAFFGRPWVSASAKWGVVVELATRWGLSPLARDFIALVARQGRADHLETIAAAYRDLVDEDLGRVRARVRAAVPLTPSEHERLQQRLGRTLDGKQVLLEEHVDDRLLGGFIAEVDSFIVDGSLDGQLARLKERLARG